MFARLKRYVKAKYFWSVFLVCGVLSISIGTPPAPDTLVQQGIGLLDRYEEIICVNRGQKSPGDDKFACGEKDPALLTAEEMDGPDFRTVPMTDDAMRFFYRDLVRYRNEIEAQSDARALAVYKPDGTIAPDGPRRLQAVVDASIIYFTLQQQLYANYMRLAHETPWKAFRRLTIGEKFGSWGTVASQGGRGGMAGVGMPTSGTTEFKTVKQLNEEKWAAKNAEAKKSPGAGAFQKGYFDNINLRLNERIGLEFFNQPDYGLKFNIRHAKNEKTGGFERIEVFISEEDKRLMEYAALADPRSKDEYMKLLQFAGLREGLVNRWALRRMLSYETFDGWKSDAPIAACAPELVSFRLGGKSTQLTATAMYSSLWQEDSHTTLMNRAKDIADKMAEYPGIGDTPENYARLIVAFYEKFPSGAAFLARIPAREVLLAHVWESLLSRWKLQNTQWEPQEKLSRERTSEWEFHQKAIAGWSDREALVRALAVLPDYAPLVMGAERDFWTLNPLDPTSPITPHREAFVTMSLPADDLSAAAVAERYTWKSREFRKVALAKVLATIAKQDGLPEAQTGLALTLAAQAIREFFEQKNPVFQGNVFQEHFKTHHGYQTGEAVKKFAWQDYPYVKDRAQKRYDEFKSGVKPLAVKGALGYQVRKAAEKLLKTYSRFRFDPPSDDKYISGQRFQTKKKKSWKDEYLETVGRYASDDLTPYVKDVPFRLSWQLAGLSRAALPSTPEQIQSFFNKKLRILTIDQFGLGEKEVWGRVDGGKRKYMGTAPEELSDAVLAEEKIAKELSENDSAMHGMSLIFQAIGKAYAEAKEKKHPEEKLPAAAKLVAASRGEKGKGKGGKAASCQTVLVNRTPVGAPKGAPVRGAVTAPAIQNPAIVTDTVASMGQAKAVEAKCVDAPVDEEIADRALLESVIVEAAKAGLKEYEEALGKAPTYKYPERAEKASKWAAPFGWNPVSGLFGKAQPTPPLGPVFAKPSPTPSVKASPLPPLTAQQRRFRLGRDQSLAMNENPAYVATDEGRRRARELVVEGLAMLGLGEAVTGQKWRMNLGWFRLQRVTSFLATEHFIARQMPQATLLERMVGTLTDQLAVGQALEQEAYARSPILAIQDTWKPQSEEDAPNLLARLSAGWTIEKGWDDARFEREFRGTLVRAAKNDVGKIETYCKADLRRYEDDVNFHTMFGSLSGIRSALSAVPGAQEWDDQIKLEARTEKQVVLAFLDKYGMIIFVGMMLIIAWQFAPIILAAFNAGGVAAVVQTVTAYVGKLLVTKAGWLMLTGNLAPINILFTTQTFLMVSINLYLMPPQIKHHFEVANSQILKTSLGGYLLDRNLADRDQMHAMRKELATNEGMTYFAMAAEIGAFAGFTVPGVYRTLGMKGADRAARLARGVDPKITQKFQQLSMRQLIQEHGWKKGAAMYAQRLGVSMRTLNRVGSALPGATARTGLLEAAAEQLARQFKSKEDFVRFLDQVEDDLVAEARTAMRNAKASEAEMTKWAAEMAAKEIDLHALDQLPVVKDYLAGLRTLSPEARTSRMLEYIKVARKNDTRLLGVKLDKSPAQRQIDALLEAGRARDILDDLRAVNQAKRDVAKAAVSPGEPELQNYFRQTVMDGRFDKFRSVYMKHRKKFFDKPTRVEAKKIFADLDYLMEDSQKAGQFVRNSRDRARAMAWSSGRINLAYDELTGDFRPITAEELAENPEEYTWTVRSIEQIVPYRAPRAAGPSKAQNAVQRMREAGRRRGPSSVDEGSETIFTSPADPTPATLRKFGVQ